jgi:bifunctional non-homologous end joining protein LigD
MAPVWPGEVIALRLSMARVAARNGYAAQLALLVDEPPRSGGHIRHPSLKGFRKDKSASDVIRESSAASREAGRRTLQPRTAREAGRTTVLYPALRFTRHDLAELYRDIAEWVIPHVTHRPITMVRCRRPVTDANALRTQCVFVRHAAPDSSWAPAEIPRVRIREKKKVGHYLALTDVHQLVALIERGVVEIHLWNACADDVEHPDRVIFDLDPGEGTTWADVVSAARRVRAALETLDLDSWPKTTGGRGLHIVSPFRSEHAWDSVFAFSRTIAEHVVAQDPRRLTLSFAKSDRSGKVLIDYKRNYRTSIAVAGYSARAKPGGTMSVPLSWREVTARLKPDHFTVATIRARLGRLKADPWAGYWKSDQRLRL